MEFLQEIQNFFDLVCAVLVCFADSYNAGKATNSWSGLDLRWRAYILCWLARRAVDIEGDFVECGVNKGGLALTVMEFIEFSNLDKVFYLLDTFCGLSNDHISDELID